MCSGEGVLAFQSVFSVQSIARVVRSGDSQRFNQSLVDDGVGIIEAISAAAIARTVVLSGYLRAKVRSKFCVTYTSYPTNLVLRTVAAYLARRFRVVPANRDRVVAGAIESMMDATPFTIIRRDVTSFYESIDADSLRDRLIYDTSLPRSVRHYLALFFDAHCPRGQRGLPRGIGLTAVLAELAMERFDQQVRALTGVYRYFRYSDDIVVFAYTNVPEIEREMATLLPSGMEFNQKKCDVVDFTKKDSGVEKAFEYLGYKLSTLAGTGGKIARPIDVTVAPAKIKRLKSRVVLSLKSFRKTHDGDLLIDRLRLLSANYQLNRHGVSTWLHGKRIRSGVFYNYRRCGRYAADVFTEIVPESLSDLDNFVHTLIKSPRSEFRGVVSSHLNAGQLARINRISFRLGFASRRMVRMTYGRLATVKAAWRNG